jgi:hypothetical protein
MNDYLLHELAQIRIDELRAEATRSRAAQNARETRGHRRSLGFLGGLWAIRAEASGISHEATQEACCA